MSKHLYLIEVTGDIISEEGNQYALGWSAFNIYDVNKTQWSDEKYNPKTHSFSSDLRLNKTRRAVPYALYYSIGGTGVRSDCSDAGLTCAPGFFPAFAYLEENLNDIEDALSVPVQVPLRRFLYNGLYVSTFSALELFLSDCLLCGVFSDDFSFSRAVSFFQLGEVVDPLQVENAVRNETEKKIFHRFDHVKKMYKDILGKDLPDTESLKEKIHKRHNIVHRCSLSNIDRMTVCDATEEDVHSLIETVAEFASDLRETLG